MSSDFVIVQSGQHVEKVMARAAERIRAGKLIEELSRVLRLQGPRDVHEGKPIREQRALKKYITYHTSLTDYFFLI